MLGKQTVMTSGIAEAIKQPGFYKEIMECLDKFTSHDWGNLCDEDKESNDYALTHEERIVAKYDTTQGNIYIITEWDRSVTTILFTDEY